MNPTLPAPGRGARAGRGDRVRRGAGVPGPGLARAGGGHGQRWHDDAVHVDAGVSRARDPRRQLARPAATGARPRDGLDAVDNTVTNAMNYPAEVMEQEHPCWSSATSCGAARAARALPRRHRPAAGGAAAGGRGPLGAGHRHRYGPAGVFGGGRARSRLLLERDGMRLPLPTAGVRIPTKRRRRLHRRDAGRRRAGRSAERAGGDPGRVDAAGPRRAARAAPGRRISPLGDAASLFVPASTSTAWEGARDGGRRRRVRPRGRRRGVGEARRARGGPPLAARARGTGDCSCASTLCGRRSRSTTSGGGRRRPRRRRPADGRAGRRCPHGRLGAAAREPVPARSRSSRSSRPRAGWKAAREVLTALSRACARARSAPATGARTPG